MQEKGYMMSGKCWLKSIYSSPVVHPRALITPSHSWMSMQRKSGLHALGMVWCRRIWRVRYILIRSLMGVLQYVIVTALKIK